MFVTENKRKKGFVKIESHFKKRKMQKRWKKHEKDKMMEWKKI